MTITVTITIPIIITITISCMFTITITITITMFIIVISSITQALRWHPDKNRQRLEQATKTNKGKSVITTAYI